MQDLKDIRKQIDETDKKLLELLCHRLDCSKAVAEYKKQTNTPILNSQREKEILQRVYENSGEYKEYATHFFSNILELSRSLQHDMLLKNSELRRLITTAKADFEPKKLKIACPGIPGSNTNLAQKRLADSENVIFFDSFSEVFEAIDKDEADMGIVPVENSSVGSVSEVYDLILKYRFYIVGAIDMKIDNSLCACDGADFSDIKKVISHPQALKQCSKFVEENNLEKTDCENTSIAAKLVADKNDKTLAAVCNKYAAKQYGLNVIKENIENYSGNNTRFILISKTLFIKDNADKISLCFTLPNDLSAGSLYNVLTRFNALGLNLTKIESRPVNKDFKYLFYLDFKGSIHDPHVLNLLCALDEELPQFNFLGNYEEELSE